MGTEDPSQSLALIVLRWPPRKRIAEEGSTRYSCNRKRSLLGRPLILVGHAYGGLVITRQYSRDLAVQVMKIAAIVTVPST